MVDYIERAVFCSGCGDKRPIKNEIFFIQE